MERSAFTIYIVDSDPSAGQLVSALVRSAGYQAAFFQRPIEFVRGHDESTHGCVVFDDEAWEHHGLRDVLRRRPGINLTTSAKIEGTVSVIRSGAINVLTKPVDQSALLASIA